MSIKKLTPSQVQEMMATGEAILIDVRESDEFRSIHIPQAISMPLSQIQETFQHLSLPKGTKVIFQCLRGGRGEQACGVVSQLTKDGTFYNLDGGLDAWCETGFPVIKTGGKVSIFRQVQMIIGLVIAALVAVGFLHDALGFLFAGLVGLMLSFSGFINWCGLGLFLQKMPWNR